MNNFKNNADKLLYDFGLLNELKNYGTPYIVGSYAMDLLAWNDLDIYVSNETMSTEKLYELTSFILNTFHPVWYEAKKEVIDGKTVWFHGFETEILGELCNVDVWFFDKDTIAKALDFSKNIKQKLLANPELKEVVINIKQSLIENEQYGFDKILSMDVYKAVFEDNIRSYKEFIENYGV
ncbi:MAG: hypothetical protein E7573_06895 [Ruminococcaceae bacterium]|nr:hypothetical protein [Oscillospiraceae bacterium]